ncbi:hypothetical protein KI387_041594, partial [Taxus chinensis]
MDSVQYTVVYFRKCAVISKNGVMHAITDKNELKGGATQREARKIALEIWKMKIYTLTGGPREIDDMQALDKMPQGRISTNINSPTVGVFVDMGHPLLNRMVDGFLKIGSVGASRVAAEEAYSALDKGRVSKHDLEQTLKKMGKEGLQWGTIAGLYAGMEYGTARVRGRRDWKNALIGGFLTGAVVSLADNNNRDKTIKNAITGGAIATAS